MLTVRQSNQTGMTAIPAWRRRHRVILSVVSRIRVPAVVAGTALAGVAALVAVTAFALVTRHPRTASPRAGQGTIPLAAGRLSPAQLAGQRVIYSYRGLTPPPALLQLIRRGEAAGVIFFAGNIASPAQLAAVAGELQRANLSPANPVHEPLLLMTDQEGGAVRRLPGPPELSEKQIGQSAAPAAQARQAGLAAAANLRGAGLNVNLAPVLDVYRAAGDFIDQFGRSYSGNPRQAAHLGAEFIAAQQAGGVAATAKHFPGLGAATRAQDTDLRPVTLDVPRATLRGVDELPYRAAIAAGVKLVMVSWAVYPALDPARPAGLSPVIVQGELRHRLGFRGVTITDALGAGALAAFGGIGPRSRLAALAGMDLLLCSNHRVAEGQQALAGLAAGYATGQVSLASGRAAVARILALRAGLPG
jgi:beta-N-acetylhexosaminidase